MRVSSADRLMHILCCRSVMHESARRPFVRPLTACRSAAMATAPSVPAKAFPAGSLANEPDRSRRGTGPISTRNRTDLGEGAVRGGACGHRVEPSGGFDERVRSAGGPDRIRRDPRDPPRCVCALWRPPADMLGI